MKSIKPGRGPSFQGVAGSIVAIVFGIFWTVMAFSITADSPFPVTNFFPFFGLIFIGLGIFQAIYHYKNATGKNRMSVIDIVDSDEEPDPLNARFGRKQPRFSTEDVVARDDNRNYCPYCGQQVQNDFNFCPTCGKRI
ncbi:zinc-ribbon domain-containing protein [Anoxybacillus sp. J5B_2022]|uniref:zinc-ribbon domain-containing protein n=1 Tax=Anoxybacillus sp. J5B_2022 TaxID=3003246 RepID=UPI0022869509|nr:zinc-ribbon domain-containing protein [Anoxybacillus sp. J5B_2022]MCZ0754190.1 zinc-ribbon domain-containing protein [Anoxybacillus sp. J5B_2022]